MNCKACDHIHAPQGGHCYMFKNKPVTDCGQHTGRREVLLGSTDTTTAKEKQLSKEHLQDELITAFAEFASEYPKSALSLIADLLVAHLECCVEEKGGDKNLEIKIELESGRNITLSEISETNTNANQKTGA